MSDILKRPGMFKVSNIFVRENPEQILGALKDVLIVKIDNDFMSDSLIYQGYSKCFDIVKDSDIVPEYEAVVNSQNNAVSWKRLDCYSKDEVQNILNKIYETVSK